MPFKLGYAKGYTYRNGAHCGGNACTVVLEKVGKAAFKGFEVRVLFHVITSCR